MSFDLEHLKSAVARLAAGGVFLGTSSWKYEGWLGQIYTTERYLFRGKLSKARFNRDCLAEYAQVFPTVCVDAAYYTFPSSKYLEGLAAQVPPGFRFGLKVTDLVTIKKFPRLDRFGPKSGKPNADFLNADLFQDQFLGPCEAIRQQVGVIIFEFSKFWRSDYEHGSDFLRDLDGFLAALPSGWPYAVELRNRHWLRDDYFAVLERHRVSHVFNSWTDAPLVSEQLAMPASRPNPNLVAARFLLRPGRSYEAAVKSFSPYNAIQDPYEEGRRAGADLITEGVARGTTRRTYIYVNNRFEGSALFTMAGMLQLLPGS